MTGFKRKSAALFMALSLLVAAFTGFSVTSVLGAEEQLTILPCVLVNSKGDYNEYQVQDMITANVGDILEVTVSMKTLSGKTQRTTGIDIKTMFANTGRVLKAYDNDGTLVYTNKHYEDGTLASVPALGTVVTTPDAFDTPDPTRSHFGYTSASYRGAGGFRNWTELYSFTLIVNKSGRTAVETYITGVYKPGSDNSDDDAITDFDYKMEIVNHGPIAVPTTTAPVPTTTEPAPTTTAPVPTTTEPVPSTTAPVPTTTEPVEPTTAPVPTATSPIPETTAQVTEPIEPTTAPAEPRLVYGDVNLDGGIDVNDVTLIQKHAATLIQLEGLPLKAADVTHDGGIDINDATKIQKFIAGLIDNLGE